MTSEHYSGWKLSSPTAILTAVLCAFILFILSLRTVIDPTGAATAYGMPLSSHGDIPWMYVKAGRDLGVGVALAALLFTRQRRAVAVFLIAATLMPLADFLIVITHTGRVMFALGVHGSAAIYTLVLGLVLLRRSPQGSIATTPRPAVG
jgi:hypothetical protein